MILTLRLGVVRPAPANNRSDLNSSAIAGLVGDTLGSRRGFASLNIKNIQNRAPRCGCASASGNCLCQQPFQLAQINDPGANIVQVTGRNVTYVATACFVGATEPEQRSNISRRKA